MQGQHAHTAKYQSAMEFNKKETLIFFFLYIFKILDINHGLENFRGISFSVFPCI